MLLTAPAGHPSLSSWVDLDDEAVSVVTLVAPHCHLDTPHYPPEARPPLLSGKEAEGPMSREEERDGKEILT